MELSLGFKWTDVGAIPEDWDVVPLGDLRPFVTSGSRGWASYYSEDGDLFVRITNLTRDCIYLDLTNCKFVRLPAEATEGIRTKLAERDVLISITADIGIVGYVDANVPLPAYINQHIALVRFDPSKISGQFVAYFLASAYPQRLFRSSTDTGAKAGMSLGTVQTIQTAFPPLPEQCAIAAALSDVDALLEALKRLIEKKRALRQAATRQLLTSQTRLPGFNGEWMVKSLATLCSMKSGEGITAESIDEFSQYPCYGGNGLRGFASRYTHHGRYALIGRQGALCGNVFGIDGQFFASEHAIVVMASAGTDIGWLTYVLGMMNLNQYSESSAQPGLSVARLLNLEVATPNTKAEQAAIAAALSDMAAELSALEARRDKTRALKQAMMQELLTGRTRLGPSVLTESRKDAERTDGRQPNIHFKRSVLAAEIIDRLHNEPTFGHVKFEKMIYLVEHLCDVDTGSTYHRDAAGPYDNRAIRSIDSQLRRQKWFDAQKVDDRYRYQPMANRGKHKEYFERYFPGIGTTFDTVIETFRSFTTERCEIVATLFGAWRDLLQQNDSVSDDAIVNEVLNNWHKSKKRIPEERWRKALSWMRDHGFVPRKAIGA